MKIRYYLRGLGLGILVTAIFFMVSGKNSQPMSDEMIKARAKELGMSESVVLSELSTGEIEETAEEIATKEETVSEQIEETVIEETVAEEMTSEETVSEEAEVEEPSSEEAISEESTEETVVEVASQSSNTEEAETESESSENMASNTEPVTVTVTVNRGEGSDTVSRRLQEAGLVADAHEYDKYLMANGYDKRIGVGEHVIPAGATWEEIAKTLCNMK